MTLKSIKIASTLALLLTVDGVLTRASAGSPGQTGVHLIAAMPITELQGALRGLWAGHANTVYAVAKAAVAGDEKALAAAEAEVVTNAKAIAGAVEGFYGADAGKAMLDLLVGHYGGVKAYMTAAIANDKAGESAAIDAITANAEKISMFLSSANPNLPKDDVMGLLQAHAGHHIGQIQQLIAKDQKGADQTQIDMIGHLNAIADALAGALAKQFPEMIKA